MSEIKTCPFCGESDVTCWHGVGEYWCCCDICDASTKAESSKEEAIAAWNRRADGGIPVGELRALVEQMRSVASVTEPGVKAGEAVDFWAGELEALYKQSEG